ncbi:EAL domain-containing protein [Hyphococcus formosus]|uniref:EAL domain-containing protein n=1 Tax=Hyphococcus formosus TaxID=3143534 RepID=UPI00398AFE73
MITVSVFGVTEGVAGLAHAELLRGAIAGAFIVALAFLAGYAAIRRSGLAVCAMVMVAGAAALEFSWLGFFSGLPAEGVVMMQALFGAAAIVFLSAAIGAARYNPLLGGVMFTAALVIAGMGAINFLDRIELSGLMRWSLIGVGGFAVVLSAIQAFRGDSGARLVLPGIALAAAAPIIALFGSAESGAMILASHGLFTLGVLAASLVALTELPAAQLSHGSDQFSFAASNRGPVNGHERHREYRASREASEIVLDSQIARVLDYSGVGIWDWGVDAMDQTASLPALMGADSNAPFTPDAMREFVHKDDAPRFDSEIMSGGDGAFDTNFRLFDGRVIRMRGARAADEDTGEIERLVAFVEEVSPAPNGVSEDSVRSATEAAVVPTAALSADLTKALENGDINAAFQPVVALDNGKVAGFEALARWRDQKNGADEGPEQFVIAAENCGKGGELARTMLDQAAAFLSETLATERRKDLFVAMNVSWGQIRDESFPQAVKETIAKYNLPKKALVLELTEADAISDVALAGEVFKKLKEAGASLAFDDFGAGFTCLSNLRKYDFDYLKIDKSFTAELENGGDNAKIVSALANLGKELGLKVILEGIETKGAAHKARQMGCSFGQGYLFGKPIENEVAPAPVAEPAESTAETSAELTEEPAQDAAPELVAEKPSLKEDEAETVEPEKAPVPENETALAEEEVESDEASFEEDDEPRGRRWKFWGGAGDLR